jgi:hypothetical protein
MSEQDKGYFAQRAAEEAELAMAAADETSRVAHLKLQRAYTELASVGDRERPEPEVIG